MNIRAEQGPAVFSEDRQYRYTLHRRWGPEPSIMWIGLNPSTADENQLDPTLRRVMGFTQAWGYGGFWMTNLFAFRATVPRVMQLRDEPVGPDNDKWLLRIAAQVDIIVCAWGVHGCHKNRDVYVVHTLLQQYRDKLKCLGMTTHGHPKHPLYLAGDTALLEYPPA